MSSGARVMTAIAVQTDPKVMATSGFKILPNKTNGLNNSMELSESELVAGERVKKAGMVTSGSVSGDIETEFMFGVFDDLIASAMWNQWTSGGGGGNPDTLKVGELRTMYTITKDFTDIGVFHVFGACHTNTMSMEISTEGIVGVKFGFIGLDYNQRTTTTFAPSATKSQDGAKASGLNIGTVLVGGEDIGVCVESISIEIDNGALTQRCLGKKYGGNVLPMLASISGKMSIAYSKKAHEILTNQVTGATLSLEIPMEFEGGNKYIFRMPKVQVKGDIPSPSGSDLAVAEVEYSVVDESMIIERYTA